MKVESSNLVDLWIFGDFMQTLQDLKKVVKNAEDIMPLHLTMQFTKFYTKVQQ